VSTSADAVAVSPIGFIRDVGDDVALLLRPGSWDHEDPLMREVVSGVSDPLCVFEVAACARHPVTRSLAGRRVAPASWPALIASLRRFRAVIDVPALHAGDAERAVFLGLLCRAGVPVVAHALAPRVRELLGEPVTGLLAEIRTADLSDLDARELLSIRLRRCAIATVSPTGAIVPGDDIPVSVVLATKRGAWLDHALRQASAQTYRALELVVVLHGDRFEPGIEARMRRLTRLPLTVLRAPGSVSFGAALNRGVEAAAGRIVTKLDDDDFYAPEHVTDVVQALGYSGATLAGKHSMFLYLADVNTLIRRVAHLCESYSRLIAGATLTIAREDLIAIGGFRSIQRAVDQRLKDDVEAHGGRIYRGHGYGFVVNRHGSGHTWTVDSAYFLKDARSRWPGCPLEVAGFAKAAADDSRPGATSRTEKVSAT
jgi:hypothetical protein